MRTTSPRPIRFLVVAARPWRVLLVAVVALVATSLPPAPAPPAAAAARASGPLVPSSGFYVGAYTKHIDGYGQQRAKEAMNDLESRLGRRLHINHHFYAWADAFPSWREPWDIENDRIPMISWNGENTDSIAKGDWDGMIAARAQAVAMLNTPVYIRWFWEMDGNKKQGFISTPASYQKAWRHIVDVFRAAGANNAVWVWCPNASAIADGTALKYYPGAGYVDWVCGDGYNFAPNRPGDKWETFAQVYNGFYAGATKLGKPIMIGEFGVLERKPGEKDQWFRQAHDWIQAHPAIAAVVYFNADSTTNNIYLRLAGRHVAVGLRGLPVSLHRHCTGQAVDDGAERGDGSGRHGARPGDPGPRAAGQGHAAEAVEAPHVDAGSGRSDRGVGGSAVRLHLRFGPGAVAPADLDARTAAPVRRCLRLHVTAQIPCSASASCSRRAIPSFV